MSFFQWPDYVSVAERRRRAERKLAQLRKKGQPVAPVKIEGRVIATSFWGKSWCQNLERYSDYATRLPRGRSYVRNGSVLDLQIAPGHVAAMVSGSDLYTVKVTIEPVTRARWKSICRDCAGGIDSLIELLQGRLAKGVMDRVCREGDGLFPAPGEIKLSCSCPDWADMCKHVAAVLYGVGARLDEAPRLLFVLRKVDESELLTQAGPTLPMKTPTRSGTKVLGGANMAALFGLEMADAADASHPAPAEPDRRTKAANRRSAKARATRKPLRRKQSKVLSGA
jgi:uncharacterized Zn finger protein